MILDGLILFAMFFGVVSVLFYMMGIRNFSIYATLFMFSLLTVVGGMIEKVIS